MIDNAHFFVGECVELPEERMQNPDFPPGPRREWQAALPARMTYHHAPVRYYRTGVETPPMHGLVLSRRNPPLWVEWRSADGRTWQRVREL